MNMLTKLSTISVVITTKNEEKNIDRCLESIQSQTYPKNKIEIIVIDNNSTDKTKEISRQYIRTIFNYPPPRHKLNIKNYRGAQLNFGVSRTKGEIIFYPDADMTYDPGLITEAVGLMKTYDALYVPETIIGKGWFGKVRNFERSFYNETVVDGVRFVSRKLFNQVGGFDVENISFGADDWDFTKTLKKNKAKLGITKLSLFHHEEALDITTYITKKGKYVPCFDDYIKKWGKKDPDVKKQLGVWYRAVIIFTEKGKWKKLTRNPLLVMGMYFIRFLTWGLYKVK